MSVVLTLISSFAIVFILFQFPMQICYFLHDGFLHCTCVLASRMIQRISLSLSQTKDMWLRVTAASATVKCSPANFGQGADNETPLL